MRGKEFPELWEWALTRGLRHSDPSDSALVGAQCFLPPLNWLLVASLGWCLALLQSSASHAGAKAQDVAVVVAFCFGSPWLSCLVCFCFWVPHVPLCHQSGTTET